MITQDQLFRFLPDFFGIAVLILPFAVGVSPLEAIYSYPAGIVDMAAPALLVIPIAAWQVLRAVRAQPKLPELVLAYTSSILAMWSPLTFGMMIVTHVSEASSHGDFYESLIASLSGLTLIAANFSLLVYNLKTKAPASVTAGVFLIGGYLPNTTFCLVVFLPDSILSGWSIGAFVAVFACVGYVARNISLMRHGTKAYRPDVEPGST